MSQTETLLLVALGFSLGGLVFLFIGRFIWNLALKIGARRMQRQVPASVAELRTERDRLRADYALISQKLSQRLETAKTRMAEQMAEASRSRNRIQDLTIILNDRDGEIAGLKQEVAALTARAEASEEAHDKTLIEVAALRSERDQQALRIGDLETTLAQTEARLAELEATQVVAIEPATVPVQVLLPPPADTETSIESGDGLKHRIEALTALSHEIAASRSSETEPPTQDSHIQERLAQAARDAEELQRELARLDAAWAARLNDLEAKDVAAGRKPRGVANVISLANRIKALQKDIARQ
jgi:chromosome segregation ATPase